MSWILILLSKDGNHQASEYRVLYLSKPIFNDDVEALKIYGKQCDYIKFPRMLMFPILKHFLPYANELNDANYYPKTKNDPSVLRLRSFWLSELPFIKKKLNFDAILSGNFVYINQQEFFIAAKKIQIPTFILYKEGMFPIDRSEDVIDIFYKTKQFNADKIFFYNENIKKTLLASNLPGLDESKTSVVGVPRLDHSIRNKITQCRDNKVLLFLFAPKVKSQYLFDDSENIDEFEKKLSIFQQNFLDLAIKHPQIDLIIKSKSDPVSILFFQSLLKKNQITKLPDNITFTSTKNPSKLILDSTYIAGYSSTTLIEALIHKKTIISPDVKDFFGAKSPDLFGSHNLGVNYVNNINLLEDLIIFNSPKRNHASSHEVDSFLESMIYKADGNASIRVEEYMIKEIKNIN